MEVIFEEVFFTKFRKLIKLQNILLLSIIAKDNGWDLKELKKKYLRDKLTKKPNDTQDIKLVLKKKKVKDKSPNTKNFIQKQLENEEEELIDNNKTFIKDKKTNDETNAETNEVKDINEEVTTDINSIKCKKYSFMENIYYVSNKNYVYDELGSFVGIMEDDTINFDGEESYDDE